MTALFFRGLPTAAALVALIAVSVSTPVRAQGRIAVQATPITHFDTRDPELRRFGKLEFRGGLQLSSPAKEFGGISSLLMQDGGRFVAVTDTGRWLRGRIVYSGSKPSAVADVDMAPMLAEDGRRLMTRRWFDTESMAEDAGAIYVGVERVHRIVKFDFAKAGFKARGVPVPVPEDFGSLSSNKGIEAMAVVPQGQPLAGALIAISEASLDAAGNTRAFLLDGPRPGTFAVKRSEGFDVTDCALLPNGDLLLLERRFALLNSAVRMRRIAGAQIAPGAVVDGGVIFHADFGQQIDNFEALGVHRAASGETVVTLISDDNFSVLQRTLLMQFTLYD